MSTLRKREVGAAVLRARYLVDTSIHNDIHKQQEFRRKTILADKSLSKDEKAKAVKKINRDYDARRVIYNEGTRRTCENCSQKCLATLYCEYCVQNYLKANFVNWTSGNDDIDNLIQKCQMETLGPSLIPEWIPFDNLRNIKYLTEGGCSKIYTADWINGSYNEWDSKKQQLAREYESITQKVI